MSQLHKQTNQSSTDMVSADPFELFAQSDAPGVNLNRVIEALKEDGIEAEAHAEHDNIAVAQLNDLDWVFSVDSDIVKVECVLPTELSFADVSEVFRTIANELNSTVFDGRVLVGNLDGYIELRGDATFVVAAGLNDDQLFHALNYAVVAAQDALLAALDTFNEVASSLEN